ncbi:MAG: TerB family tellurite resistance protein [Stellaceae bacterium]
MSRIVSNARELSFGDPIGALLGRVTRHVPHWHGHAEGERGDADPRHRVAFTIAVIALGAKMARADGSVTRDEVAAFSEVFQIPPGEEEHVRLVFDLARRSTHGLEGYARQLGRVFAANRVVLEDLLGGLFHIALADGRLCAAEDEYLREVARHFGFEAGDYARIRAHHAGSDEARGEDPQAILGVEPGVSSDALRIAYHHLVRESHPDLVIAQGLPPECIALATARAARINAAYDRLARGHPGLAASG